MNPLNSFIILSFIAVLGYFAGILFYLTDVRDFCEMTYMFEYPQFVKISQDNQGNFSKYGLYAYSEGKLTARVRDMHFTGIPVLFIPGNGGSYKQVRSLSSVALRKALDSRLSYHFDYFTLDFNEEMSGIYSALLRHQLEHLNSSIHRVLDLYKSRKKSPQSIILIGHSMGGLLALKFLSQLQTDSALVPIAITMAAPVSKPVIMLDRHIKDLYSIRTIPSSTFVVNIGGAFSDFLIPTYLTNLQQKNALNTVVSNIPRCWLETDHKQIVWCKQVILAINRALFDSVELKTMQISSNMEYIKSVFHHHFNHHSGIKVRQKDMYSSLVALDQKGHWVESLQSQYSVINMKGLRQPHTYMVAITQLPNYRQLTILAINLEQRDWIYGCNAAYPRGPSRVCIEGIHLTVMSYIAPSIKYKRRAITIDMHELKQNNSDITHVIVKAKPTYEPIVFHFDQYDPQERQITVSLPLWCSFGKHTVIENTAENALQYILDLPDLTHIVQAYNLYVEPIHCYSNSYHVSASLEVPWVHHAQHGFYMEDQKRPLIVRLLSSKPPNSKPARIVLILEPSCTYHISIKSSLATSLSLLARYYSPVLVANIAAVVLLSLKVQLEYMRKNGQCTIFFIAIKLGIKPLIILTGVLGISKFVSVFPFLPKPDNEHGNGTNIDFFMLPVLLYFCSIGIVWIFAVLFSISLVALESTIHKLVLKLLARTISFNVTWSDYLLSFLQKVPLLVALVLLFVCFSTCGGLALCLGLIFYFLKLTQMSQDIIEDVVWYVINNLTKSVKNALKKNKREHANTEQTEISNQENNVEQITTSTLKEITDYNTIEELSNNELEGSITEQLSNASATPNNIEDESQNEQLNKIEVPGTESTTTTERQENIIEKTEETLEKSRNLLSKISDQNQLQEHKHIEDQNKEQKEMKKEHTKNFTDHNSVFFHSTLFFIWFIVSCLNIPAVLTWAHNFRYSKALTPDESFIPGLVLSICAVPLWQADWPKMNRKYMRHLEIATLVIAILSLLYATVSIYRLNYFLVIQFVLIVSHQFFAPPCEDEEGIVESGDNNIKYGNVKNKLE